MATILLWTAGIAACLYCIIWLLRHAEAILGLFIGLSCWAWCSNLIPGWLNRLIVNTLSRL